MIAPRRLIPAGAPGRAHQVLGSPEGGDDLGAEVKKVLRDEFLAIAEVIPSEPLAAVAWRRPAMVFVTSPARGLAAERLTGNHLLTATDPEAVAAKLVVLMDALEPAMI